LGGGEDGRLREAQGCGANLRGPRASWGGAPRERPAGIAAVIAGGRCGRRRTMLTAGPGLAGAGRVLRGLLRERERGADRAA